jgi:ABC-type branched-subunit amino acid transport system substrate-binding protein
MIPAGRYIRAGCTLAFGFILGFTQQLNTEQVHGRQIYMLGTSPSGAPITALLGESGAPVPASTLPCAGCHGPNGEGKPEGGIAPSVIQWETLTKSYEVTLPSGRKRGPYSERSIKRAITMGFDSVNNVLGAAMPRFQISREDLTSLIAYLKIVGKTSEPGVLDDSVRIGAILPPARLTRMHAAVQMALTGYFDELNRQGGVFGRRIELHLLDYPESPANAAAVIRKFIAKENIFALTSSFIAGAEDQLADVFDQAKTPVIGAFAIRPRLTRPLNRFIFYLDAGLFGEIEALAAYARRRAEPGSSRLSVAYMDDAPSRQLVLSLEQSCKILGFDPPVRIAISLGDLTSTFATDADLVFLLAPDALLRITSKKDKAVFLTPSSLLNPTAILSSPSALDGRIFLAFSDLQRYESPDQYHQLALGLKLPAYAVQEQRMALAGASTLIEALKRTGRDLSQDRLVATLEGLSQFETGFTAPLSYGPSRRVGSMGFSIMMADLKARKFSPADP